MVTFITVVEKRTVSVDKVKVHNIEVELTTVTTSCLWSGLLKIRFALSLVCSNIVVRIGLQL